MTSWPEPNRVNVQVVWQGPEYPERQSQVVSCSAFWDISKAEGSVSSSHHFITGQEITHCHEESYPEHLSSVRQGLPRLAEGFAFYPGYFGLIGEHWVGTATFGKSPARCIFGVHSCFFDLTLPCCIRVVVDYGNPDSAAFGNHLSDVSNNSLKVEVIPLILNMYLTQSGFNLKPRSLRMKGDLVGFDHGVRSLDRFLSEFFGLPQHVSSGIERSLDKQDSHTGEQERSGCHRRHYCGPKLHPLLGIQVLLGLCLLLAGLYYFIHTFENSRRLTLATGAARMFFCCLGVGGGSIIAALAFNSL